MKTMDAIKTAAADAGIPITHIGRAMGKRDNYVSVAVNKGTVPKADTVAAMAGVCGYSLALVPRASLPDGAIVIDPPEKE